MANRIKGITVEIGGDTTKLSKALEGVNKTIKNTQTQLKDVEKLLKLDPTNTELLSQKQRLLADSITATKDKLATLKTAAEQANQALANGEISQEQYDALQREIVETENELQRLQNEAGKTNTALAQIGAAGEVLQNVGDKISGVGEKLLPVTAGVTALGTAAVKTASDFDSAMSKVAAISGATGDDLQALRDKAREMGAKTKYSATEAANAFEFMSMAGWKTNDMLGGIEGIMNLAAASGEELATTSDIVTDALTAFGLTAADSGHFADVLAAASSNANTNVGMMGETFKYAAPVAGALGFSCEDTAEAIGLMANAGIKSSSAGTSLRSIMNALAGDVSFCGESIGEVAIQTTNADGSMRELSDILADCRVVFNQLSESEQASAAQALVGKNAMSGFLAIMNTAPSDISKLSDAIENCDGTALRMAETMQDNLEGQVTILKSQLQELAISFGEILMPKIREIVSKLQAFMDKLNQMDPATKEVIIKIALIAASLGPLLIVLGKTISTIGSLMTFISNLPALIASAKAAFATLSGAFSSVIAPVLAVIAVIAALVAAFKHLWETNEEFRDKILEVWDKVKATFDRLTSGIVDRLNALGFNFKDIKEVISAVWEALCSVLAPLFEGAFNQIANIFTLVTDTVLSILDIFIGLFTGDWDQMWNGVKSLFEGVWNYIKSTFSNYIDTVKGVADVFLGWFGTSWNEVWNSVKDFFVGIWTGISTFVSDVFTGISDFFTSVWTGIRDFFLGIWLAIYTYVSGKVNEVLMVITTVWTAVSTVITTVMDAIYTVISSVWNAVYDFISPLLDAFAYLFETIFEAVRVIISRVMDWISEKIQNIWNSIVSFLTPLLEGVKNTFDVIWNAISTMISTVSSAISNVINAVWTKISGFISTTMSSIKSVISTVWNAISSIVSSVVSAISDKVSSVWSSIRDKISEVMNSIQNTVSNIWDNVKSAVSNKINGIKDTIVNGFENAVNYVKNLAGQAWSWGSDIIGGIVNGIRSKINDVASAVTSVADTIRSFLHFSVPDEGPLTDFESWMPDFMSGLAKGIQKNKKLITNAISGVAESMQFTMKTDMGVNFDGMTASMKDTVSVGTVVNNYNNSRTVNQTNNSPKSLSRLEIYRQTRNAMGI
ncbi:MAG: phage tail tape measure protein [Oscillospiraceae bacterium]|nr:phage tail tape measure protein [Oscillospiraceae bacterium]